MQLELEHKGLSGTSGRLTVPLSVPKGSSGRVEASGEGENFGPNWRDHACASRGDFSRVGKRRCCRFLRPLLSFVQAR